MKTIACFRRSTWSRKKAGSAQDQEYKEGMGGEEQGEGSDQGQGPGGGGGPTIHQRGLYRIALTSVSQ